MRLQGSTAEEVCWRYRERDQDIVLTVQKQNIPMLCGHHGHIYIHNFSLEVTFLVELEVFPSSDLSKGQNNWLIAILISEKQSVALAFSLEESFKTRKVYIYLPLIQVIHWQWLSQLCSHFVHHFLLDHPL